MISAIDYNYKLFMDDIQAKYFNKVEFELVIYDEVENFRKHTNPLFNYPYQDRKSFASAYTLDTTFFEWDENANSLVMSGVDYTY